MTAIGQFDLLAISQKTWNTKFNPCLEPEMIAKNPENPPYCVAQKRKAKSCSGSGKFARVRTGLITSGDNCPYRHNNRASVSNFRPIREDKP